MLTAVVLRPDGQRRGLGPPTSLMVLVIVIVAFGASGCGAEQLPDRSPEATLKAYLRSVAAGHRAAACSLSTACGDEVVGDMSRAGASDELRAHLRYRVRGGRDAAEVTGVGRRAGSSWELERRDGRWRVASGSQFKSS